MLQCRLIIRIVRVLRFHLLQYSRGIFRRRQRGPAEFRLLKDQGLVHQARGGLALLLATQIDGFLIEERRDPQVV